MDRLSKRVDRIEGQLEPDTGPVLRWPNRDGTFSEVRGVRSLNDPEIALAVAKGGRRAVCHDDGIQGLAVLCPLAP